LILSIHTFRAMAGTIAGTKTASMGVTNGIKLITQVAAAGMLFCVTWTGQTFA